MNRKGISPLIAAVLLIAFTMTIAGLMAAWAQNYVSGETQQLTEESDKLQECGKVNFMIDDITKTDTSLTIVVYNSGGIEIEDFDAILSYSNSTHGPVIETNSDALNETLAIGDMKSFSVTNNQSEVGMSLTKLKLVAKIADTKCPNVYREKTFSS